MRRLLVAVLAGAALILARATAAPGEQLPPHRADAAPPDAGRLNVPYAFYNECFGLAAGYVFSVSGYPERQSALLGTVMAGTKGSTMAYLAGRDIRIPWARRLFLDPIVSVGYFYDAAGYVDGNPDFPDSRAGSNDSDPDDFVTGDGWDNYFRLKFKYLLPIGHGKDQIVSAYQLREGMLVSGASGATSWNPLESGRTFLELRPFYRSQELTGDHVDRVQKTNGLDVSLFWDNRDFALNPSRGTGLRLKASRDFGWGNSTNAWTEVEGEVDQYFSFGRSSWLRQRTLVLDLWTAYSPSWEARPDGGVANRPPAYTGATLGGLLRLRGYPAQRFSDKAAICYSAELRLIPDWNPFTGWPAIQRHLGVAWLQLVPFAEVGRVSPVWDVATLHADMKWDAGLGFRAFAKGLLVRIDTAVSEEGTKVQMMIGSPFQF